ncbi:hypothetical protein Tco_1027142 [Tanacetum coccineum]
MFFYLTTFNLARFLNETAPQVGPPNEGQPSNAQVVQAVEAWKHSDFLCHNYILNGPVDSLMTNMIVTTPVNVEPPKEGKLSNAQAMQAMEAWKHSDFLCHNYVLNSLVDSLYNVYCNTKTAK